MKIAFLSLLLLASSHTIQAQVGGGAGAYGNRAVGSTSAYGNNGNASQSEAAKREATTAEQKDDGTSTFIEASILMNRKADAYVAVFGVTAEGTTPEVASTKMDATISTFKTALQALGVQNDEMYVDFVVQNRIYAFKIEDTNAKEELAGFELKKNVSVHFKDEKLIDKLVVAANRAEIYDLIKVDYIVKDIEIIQSQLQAQTAALIKHKAERYQTQLGVKLLGPTQVLADKPSVYYPVQQYSSYTAAEAENISLPYERSRYTVQNARKSRTAYFNPLNGDGFDTVINPIVIEPVVQFTTYLKVKYEAPKQRK